VTTESRRATARRSAWAVALAVCLLLPAAASADRRIDAKVRCKQEYGSATDIDAACERGVDLASRLQGPDAIGSCGRDSDDAKAAACRRGVAFHAGVAGRAPTQPQSSFSHSWEQGHGAIQLEIGDYDVVLGDAQKSIEDCQRAFEGSKIQPSCASGLRIQARPPAAPPARTAPP